MERLVEMKIAKFNILSTLNCYYRLFPLIYVSYDSEGITIQGSYDNRKILATTSSPENLLNIMNARNLRVAGPQGLWL